MTMAIVSVRGVTKKYGKVQALDGLDFDVQEGEIYGIIGPDGAGKTSLFRILATLLLADDGTASIDGFDAVKDYKDIRRIIGYMPGRFSLYQDLSVEENLKFFATIFNTTMDENYHLVEDIYRQIERFKTRRAGKLSGGMKQKLALCCSLIHAPRVLLLDEPTTGVDPVSRKEFWEMLKKLKTKGITILVSTPYMDEAMMCDRIALMQDGRFLQVDTPQDIIGRYAERLCAVRSSDMHSLLEDLRGCPVVRDAFSFGETFHVTLKRDTTVDTVARYLTDKGQRDVSAVPIEASVEDCFMSLMQTDHER